MGQVIMTSLEEQKLNKESIGCNADPVCKQYSLEESKMAHIAWKATVTMKTGGRIERKEYAAVFGEIHFPAAREKPIKG